MSESGRGYSQIRSQMDVMAMCPPTFGHKVYVGVIIIKASYQLIQYASSKLIIICFL